MLWRVTCISAPDRHHDGRAGYHRHGRFFPLGETVIVDDSQLLPGSGLLSDPHLRAEPLEPVEPVEPVEPAEPEAGDEAAPKPRRARAK